MQYICILLYTCQIITFVFFNKVFFELILNLKFTAGSSTNLVSALFQMNKIIIITFLL